MEMKRKLVAVLLVLVLALTFGVAPALASVGIPVAVDIKPQSCPNRINVDSHGVLPVAILGTEAFDVCTVNPDTVKLGLPDAGEGVSPLRWALEDVATPYVDDLDGYHDLGPDGYLDLTLKFNTQEVVAVLLNCVSDGEVLVLSLTGNLLEEHSGTPIYGQDVIVIIKKM